MTNTPDPHPSQDGDGLTPPTLPVAPPPAPAPAPPAPASPAPAAPSSAPDGPAVPPPPVAPATPAPAPAMPAPAAPAPAPAAPAPAPSPAPATRREAAAAAAAAPAETTAVSGSAAAGTGEAPRAAAVLDQDVFTTLRQPKAPGALALDGVWHQISPRYVTSQLLQNVLFLAVVVVAALVLVFVLDQPWAWIPGGILAVITVVTLAILPRQARAIGYMLRADDIVFRRGILWQRMIAVPYGRMQLVDITHGPLDRAFGIAKLKMVTAAATTGVEIPGMNQAAAEALRDTLIEVAETRRTGL